MEFLNQHIFQGSSGIQAFVEVTSASLRSEYSATAVTKTGADIDVFLDLYVNHDLISIGTNKLQDSSDSNFVPIVSDTENSDSAYQAIYVPAQNQPHTKIISFRYDAVNLANAYPTAGAGTGNADFRILSNRTIASLAGGYNSHGGANENKCNVGENYIWAEVFNGANNQSYFLQNLPDRPFTLIDTGNAGSEAAGGLTLFGDTNGLNGAAISFYNMAIYDGVVSAADMQLLRDYIIATNLWG